LFSPQKILKFWRRVLLLLLPLYGSILLLGFLAIQLSTPPEKGWQLAAKLAASLVPATLAIAGGVILSVSYLQALYALKDKREAFWHLVHCQFGRASFKPWLKVEGGKIDFDLSPANSFICQVGGPGNVVIRKDSAVVLEKAGQLTRVEGPGFPTLEPFEHVYDTIDLRPRRWQLPVSGLSKEGIPITCDTDIEFQIQDGGQQPTGETPFPVDLGAVFAAVTCKWIREQNRPEGERVLDWKGRIVVSTAEGTLRFILARYPLDRLIAPEKDGQQHPRQVICKELEKALHASAADVGARILKVELGEIKVRDEITQQWIESWQANWDRWGLEYLATSEAALLEMVGAAKSEAVARRIRDITNILHELRKSGEEAFVAGAKLQLELALRNIGSDSLALTYMPTEAMKLLQGVAHLPSPSGTLNAGPTPPGSQAPGGTD
jgi:SPFH domain / Band 7 family